MASLRAPVTTSYLIENLHCPSCVALIKSQIQETYGDQVVWVSPNLVTSIVTIDHYDDKMASVNSIKSTLEDVGFQVCAVDTTSTAVQGLATVSAGESSAAGHKGASSGWSHFWGERNNSSDQETARLAHLDNCESCRQSASERPAYNDEKGLLQILQPLDDAAKPLESVVIDGDRETSIWRATVSIGGMTCAVCTNTITENIKKKPWVSKVVVNLVTNSATIDLNDRERVNETIEAIEDLGYDASLDTIFNPNEVEQRTEWRQIQIYIDGMFCPQCPRRISKSLSLLGSHRLQIVNEPSTTRPIIELKYKPKSPSFTIRHILRAVAATDPSLVPTVYHPPTLEERSKAIRAKHQRSLWRREIMTFIIAIPTFVLGIVYMALLPDTNHTKHYLMMPWVSAVSRLDLILCLLATPVWLFAADVFHRRAIKELRSMWRPSSQVPILARFYRFGSMDMLMSLGTTVAYVSSVAQMIAATARGQKEIPHGLIYFDSVVFLTLFLLAGRLIEAYSKSKTGNAVEELIKLRPNTAVLVESTKGQGQTSSTIPLDELEHGDIIRIAKGAAPPADGIIISGETTFDESSLTGEARPVRKIEGDEIFAGTVNQMAAVTVRVTGIEGKSMLDQIVQVVREGQTKRAPVEQIADTLTSYFVPVITLIAIITWLVWLSLGLSGSLAGTNQHFDSSGEWVAFAFKFAISVFVVACPCGIGLAAPTAIFVGGGLAAKHGILAKGGGEAFEKAHKVDCVVFDKTGTLTTGGEPQITNWHVSLDDSTGDHSPEMIWSALRSLEENSSHPIAKAVVHFHENHLSALELGQIDEISGRGMKATARRDGQELFDIAAGNEALMDDLGAPIPCDAANKIEQWKTEAKSIVLVAIRPYGTSSWTLATSLAISDPIRPEAASVIEALKARGTQVWMLSGDNITTARAVASLVGIPQDNILAEVLPSEKAAKITYLQSTLHASDDFSRSSSGRAIVAMVGDGINDSPALTSADVGIAIGSGSDVAISSADFVLATSQLGTVLTLLDLSRAVFLRIKFNFGWALVYNLVAIPFAAGCFYAVRTSGGGRVVLVPEFAALAMALSSISVVLSSLSLRSGLPLMGFRAKRG